MPLAATLFALHEVLDLPLDLTTFAVQTIAKHNNLADSVVEQRLQDYLSAKRNVDLSPKAQA